MYPQLFHLYGPLFIQSYGTMIVIGFLLFLFISYRDPLRKKIMSGDEYLSLLFAGLVVAIAGGRLLFVIHNAAYFKKYFYEIFYLWEGGFASQGSVMGLLLVIPAYLWYKKVPLLQVADLVALHAPLVHAVGRIGCFLAGCCYGCPAGAYALFSVVFTNPDGHAPCFVPLVPLQLYLSLIYMVIYFFLLHGRFWLVRYPGLLLTSYIFLESLVRFFSDFWRGDRQLRAYVYLFSPTQVNALVAIIVSLLTAVVIITFYTLRSRSIPLHHKQK